MSTIHFTSFSNHRAAVINWMTGLSTIHFYIILKRRFCKVAQYLFEYHTFLHHSQTVTDLLQDEWAFEYHTFLHHSQTPFSGIVIVVVFEYHTFLHHSQTAAAKNALGFGFEYHTFYIILKRL